MFGTQSSGTSSASNAALVASSSYTHGSGSNATRSNGAREQAGSPYLSGGGYGYGQYQANHAGYSHQDYGAAGAGVYPVDSAMAWHAAYTAGHFYRGYEAASLAAADSVWSTHHQLSGFPNSSVASGANTSDIINSLLPPSDSNLQFSSPTTDHHHHHSISYEAQTAKRPGDSRETNSVSPPLSDSKPAFFFAGQQGRRLAEEAGGGDRTKRSAVPTALHSLQTGPTHSSPDSGMAISDSLSSSGSPHAGSNVVGHGNASVPGGPLAAIASMRAPSPLPPATDNFNQRESSDFGADSQPRPVRSPYQWMKRSFPNKPPANKEAGRTRTKDKYRVVYSDHQRLELEKEFHYSRYITIRRKAELAQGLSLTERQVKIWFQNRRAKERKHMKKRDEMIQKEKIDVAASFHAHHAASHMAAAAFQIPSMLHSHPGAASVMSAAAAASSTAVVALPHF